MTVEISFYGFNVNDPQGEYEATISYLWQTLYRVTDRLGIVAKKHDSGDFGDIVVFYALYGKASLLETVFQVGSEESNGSSAHSKANIEAAWMGYLADFFEEVQTQINMECTRSVINMLHSESKVSSAQFTIIEDVEYFFNKLDVVELFVLGVKELAEPDNIISQIDAAKADYKHHFYDVVKPILTDGYPLDELTGMDRRYLPTNFWWRHIDW